MHLDEKALEAAARAIWESETNVAQHLHDGAWDKTNPKWERYLPDTVTVDDTGVHGGHPKFLQKGRDECYAEAKTAILAYFTVLEASERTAFQRGAEKMREMAAGVVDENTRDAFDEDLAAAIRDLPIPTPAPEGEK